MTTKMNKEQFEINKMFLDAVEGDLTAKRRLSEAISTSDVPVQVTPSMRMILTDAYNAVETNWTEYATRETTPDFETHPSYQFQWGDEYIPGSKDGRAFRTGGLAAVGELGEYPALNFSATESSIRTRKNGVKVAISWEAILRTGNFGLVGRAMKEMGERAKRQENYEAASQLVSATGLNATNFSAERGNLLEGNPELNLTNLEAALARLTILTNGAGQRVAAPSKFNLLVPSALKPLADRLVSIPSFEREDENGRYTIGNPVAGKIAKVIEIPEFAVIGGAATDSAWFLLPATGAGALPSVVNVFLEGETAPKVFVKNTHNGAPTEGDFDHDAYETKIRHVVAGGFLDATATLASAGTGA